MRKDRNSTVLHFSHVNRGNVLKQLTFVVVTNLLPCRIASPLSTGAFDLPEEDVLASTPLGKLEGNTNATKATKVAMQAMPFLLFLAATLTPLRESYDGWRVRCLARRFTIFGFFMAS